MANGALTELQDLEERVLLSRTRAASASDLIRLARVLQRMHQQLDTSRSQAGNLVDRMGERLDNIRDRLDAGAGVIENMVARLDMLDKRLDPVEARMLIVTDLPESAPYGALIRRRSGTVAERASLYLGNGPDQPLTKLPTPTPV